MKIKLHMPSANKRNRFKEYPLKDITIPGEKEAFEMLQYSEREWKRITKGIDIRDLYGTKEMLEDAIKHYNQLQRLKPYGHTYFVDDKGTVHMRKPGSLIAHSREAAYKIKLYAKGLPEKNIEDLTATEAEEYYNAIKAEIKELQELMREHNKYTGIPTAWEDELFKAYERCALALRVIGELSGDVIPQRLLDDYQQLLVQKGRT